MRDDFQTWVSGLRDRALQAQIKGALFDRVMATLHPLPEVLDKQTHQPETCLSLHDYMEITVSDDRIRTGRQKLRQYHALLMEIEARFGVDPEVIVAFWGLETGFGATRGHFPVIPALATLAHAGRRQAFFEGELIAALRIVQAGTIQLDAMLGSWAGAMGHGQFMPSSYLDFAVDFDGDGRSNIWGDDPTDALASIANYLSQQGWQKGQPWGGEVSLPDGFDHALTGLGRDRAVADWAALGVHPPCESVPRDTPAAILLPAGARGTALMVFHNFHTILRYNRAESYAVAIGHLADRLAGAPPFVRGFPAGQRLLSRDQLCEVQTRLTSLGFDSQGSDGFMGPNTASAIRRFQSAQGLVADGFADLPLLERLRRLDPKGGTAHDQTRELASGAASQNPYSGHKMEAPMTPEQIAKLPYRPCVGIMLAHADGRVFVGQRIDAPQLGTKTAWQMPQGGVEQGEDPRDAALRELWEETGVPADLVEVEARTDDWLPYDLPHDVAVVPAAFQGLGCGCEHRHRPPRVFCMALAGGRPAGRSYRALQARDLRPRG